MTDQPPDSPPKFWHHFVAVITEVSSNTDREFALKLFAVLMASINAIIIIAVAPGGLLPNALSACAFQLVPLGLIWFPEELGSFTGYVSRGGYIDTETPPILVSAIGWLILLAIPTIATLAAFHSP